MGLLLEEGSNLRNVDRLRGVSAAANRSSWQANRLRALPFCDGEVSEDTSMGLEILLGRNLGGAG